MYDINKIKEEVEGEVTKSRMKKYLKDLGYAIFYYTIPSALPYRWGKKLQESIFNKQSFKYYDQVKSTVINSGIFIGFSLPFILFFNIDIPSITYTMKITQYSSVKFALIPTLNVAVIKFLGFYALASNGLRIILSVRQNKHFGDIVLETINYLPRFLSKILKKYDKYFDKVVEDEVLKKESYLEERRKIEEEINRMNRRISLANDIYWLKKANRKEDAKELRRELKGT
jgi:hypothetical protein